MAEPATKEKTSSSSSSSMMPDWTKLPEELLPIISENLENCFDVVHARSVCSLWRSTFPFPDCLLRPSYSLPTFNEASLENEGLCTLKKTPLFLFRVPTLSTAAEPASEYFMGGIGRDESEKNVKFPSPLQCTVKMKIGKSDPTLMNMLDCQILPLGHQYRMFCWEPKRPRDVAFLPQNKEEFVVLLIDAYDLFVLTSAEMRWKRLENVPSAPCWDVVTFGGKFYASFEDEIVVIDPYSLDVPLLMPSLQPREQLHYLVPSGNDELFLVELIVPPTGVVYRSQLTLRVSRLDEEARKWVVVSDLGDCAVFINRRHLGNVCCSAKELPDGCGVSGNSIVFTDDSSVTYTLKYGVDTGRGEDDLYGWRLSREKRVTILSTSPVVALRVEREPTSIDGDTQERIV